MADHVKYIPRSYEFTNANQQEMEEFFRRMAYMAFIKPPEKFSHEKEFRFEFAMSYEDEYVEPLMKNVILNSRFLEQYLL